MGHNMNAGGTATSGCSESLDQSRIAQDDPALTTSSTVEDKPPMTNNKARAIIFPTSSPITTNVSLRILILLLPSRRDCSSAALILMPMESRQDCDKGFKNVQFDKVLLRWQQCQETCLHQMT